MGVDYSFHVKSIATCAPTFFGYIISVLVSVTVLYFFSVTLAFPFKFKCTSYTVNFLSLSFPLYFHFSCLFLLEEKRHQLWLGSYILLCNPYFTYMGMIALETDLWTKEYGKHWRWNFFRSSTKNQSPMFFGKRLFCNSCE